MKIIITGIRGRMGSYLRKKLDKNYNIYGISRKINKRENIYSFNQISRLKINFDTIIHLAGINPGMYSGQNNSQVLKENINIHKKTLGIIKKNNIKKVIFFSTFSVYRKQKLIDENTKISKKNLYAKSKIFMEENLLNLNISTYILRISAILGDTSSNNWLSSLREKVKKNNDVEFFNPKSLYNNCISMYDIYLSVNKILKKNIYEKKIYNLSSNKPIHIEEIIKTIKKNKNYTGKINIQNNIKNIFFFNNSEKIQKELNIKYSNTIEIINKTFKKDLREKLIIIGSSGYIGNFLKEKLEYKYHIFAVDKYNLNNFLINNKKILDNDTSVSIIYVALKNVKKQFINKNIKILNKIIKYFPENNVKKFVLFSSTHSHNNNYLKLNKIREKIIKDNYKQSYYILCPGKVYGYKNIKSNYGINSFINDLNKKKLTIFGSGKNYCPHTYINDLKELINIFLNSQIKCGKYYLYDNTKINFIELANKIIKYYPKNYDIKINHTGKDLKYKIYKPYSFDPKNFKYSNLDLNIKKILDD